MQSCAHQLAMHYGSTENLVWTVIAVKGGPCTGKTTLARALAKSLLWCTPASHDYFPSTFESNNNSLLISADTLPISHLDDPVLWRLAERQLRRRHGVIVDSSLHTPAHLDRFMALVSSKDKDAEVIPIIIECWAKDKSEWRRRLSETYGPRDTERILEEDDGSCDTAGDIPKLIIDTTSEVGIKEHVRNMENFILSCLHKKLWDKMPISELASGCTDCKMYYVEKVTAHLPTTINHQCHEHELALNNCAKVYASGLTLKFRCNCCGRRGNYLHYYCPADSCTFFLHAKCALNLPQTVTANFHRHPLVLAYYRPSYDLDEIFCDFCEELRNPEDSVYYCETCNYAAHISCTIPELPESPDLVQYIDQ